MICKLVWQGQVADRADNYELFSHDLGSVANPFGCKLPEDWRVGCDLAIPSPAGGGLYSFYIGIFLRILSVL